ncbi:type II toxin-antitoxin system VapC family toxin [uncultured Caulobacter sp.]|uniref:type II toxin-antitoxin system VapC family toxin n=1 Tax=uncultured Caulobacter sp. TaxID=158749 RepID=UPI0026360245|nr:type II toxin-antitoxin system VapC family toxin [uncultured Caulobacter sp.]
MKLVVDTSALVAIALEEAECDAFIDALEAAEEPVMSPMTYVELGIVLLGREITLSQEDLDDWLGMYRVSVAREPVIDRAALDAFVRYGKGRHPARLNLSDCFAYALAKALDAPLLYKGDDFSQTDVRAAI